MKVLQNNIPEHNSTTTVVEISLWIVPRAFVLDFIVLRISLQSPNAAYFSAITHIHPHAALFRPAQNWMSLHDNVHPLRHIQKNISLEHIKQWQIFDDIDNVFIWSPSLRFTPQVP